ncbi:methyltransferase domain-containing protein [Streptomyces sp. 8ZJF_21]|uniref:methyltransferase domain-containing protein n=1 Tax=Streptomyces sp. 8ZJF_21 TaxID=2903141 RepID=UPI001E2B86C7|nr:methyltransferase domain-containing protein [Streptomyces sp. 8ZJF_21]MCD9586563.1 methyltransferase domain-containing protein [Streptomyces sp. 8ZJF_21]
MSHASTVDVLIVEHMPREGPYAIGVALEAAGLPVRACRTWAGDPVPDSLGGAAALVVMGGPAAAYEDFPGRTAELALLRTALEAEVPVLGVCLGAQLLAEAAGGRALPGRVPRIGWGEVRTAPAAHTDPLFADAPERLPVLHRHGDGDTVDLPAGATLLAFCDRHQVQAFRIGGSAWGLRFHLEVDKSAVDAFAAAFPDEADEASATPGLIASAPGHLADLAPHRDAVFARFAALVATRAARSATRTFFTPMAATWEERFAADTPRYAAAVARMGLRSGRRALDVGCGSGRALPALRAEVGDEGAVVGVELTPAMLTATAAVEGRAGLARLLMADACRLPFAAGAMDGIFSAGLINHVPDPAAALCEWARVTAPGGVLLLFHPSGRAERAARHGRPLDPDDPLAEENLRPALHAAGWALDSYEDATRHFLARAVRVR